MNPIRAQMFARKDVSSRKLWQATPRTEDAWTSGGEESIESVAACVLRDVSSSVHANECGRAP